ncbi:MAG: TauD/TfdA family dioxygenase [Candidatus Xenobia bacterium]
MTAPGVRPQLARALLAESGLAFMRIDSTEAMLHLISELGTPSPHHQGGPIVWDVRYTPGAAVRSRTLQPFPFHTDSSFEDSPPNGMALYVLRQDACGGGYTRLLEARKALEHLSPLTRHRLREPVYRFTVPPEFDKGTAARYLPILYGGSRVRYRREIIDERNLSPHHREALDDLDRALADHSLVDTVLLPAGTLLLLDNTRWLHGRSVILDAQRHLQRIRFHY